MAISSYQIIYNRRSRSRSRSPLSTETESSTTHSLSLRDRSRFRSRESTSTSNSHLNLESLETHERANHTARRLLHLVRSFFRAKPRSRSRSRNEKVEEPKVMDRGPTIVENLSPFFLPPLLYDEIRPAKAQRGTKMRQRKDNQSSSNVKVIPIQFKHEKSITASAVVLDDDDNLVKPTSRETLCKNSLKSGRCESPILIDCFNGIDQKTENDLGMKHQGVKETLLKKGSNREEIVLDISETPKVKNEILPVRGQTAIACSKGKWTVIPIHHINKEPAEVTITLPFSRHGDSEKMKDIQTVPSFKRSGGEEDEFEIIPSLTQNSQKIYPTIYMYDGDSEKSKVDSLPSSINDASNSMDLQLLDSIWAPEKDLLTEQEVNPTPSYPIYAELKKQLAMENRKIDYIRGDGNCFFRTVSKQLYGTEKYHKALRSLTVDIVATNRSVFVQFIDGGDLQAHLHNMSAENTWATTCEIYAAATLLQRDIFMLTPDHSNTHYSWLLFKPLFKLSSETDKRDGDCAVGIDKCSCYLTLCNTNGNHYDRVVPDHGGCNCFLPVPQLNGQSGSVDLT